MLLANQILKRRRLFVVTSVLLLAAASSTCVLMYVSTCPAEELPRAAPHDKHPLDAVLQWAEQATTEAAKIKDYSAQFVKRERVDGKLQETEFARIKIRHQPFSVYMRFVAPDSQKGREVIYVEGQNDGKLLAHEKGTFGELLGTISLRPDGRIAMRGQRYPITEMGVEKLGRSLIDSAKRERAASVDCVVRLSHEAKIDKRPVTCILVKYLDQREQPEFSLVRIFVDQEWKIPVRLEAYGWPKEPDGTPPLVEEYTYHNLRLNPGFSDLDFDPQNPAYAFP